MDSRDWYAWLNIMPPKPDDFHVVGEVEAPSPGFHVRLVPRHSRDDEGILLLDLLLIPEDGPWPEVVTWMQARFDKIMTPGSLAYDRVNVFSEGQRIADIPVDLVG